MDASHVCGLSRDATTNFFVRNSGYRLVDQLQPNWNMSTSCITRHNSYVVLHRRYVVTAEVLHRGIIVTASGVISCTRMIVLFQTPYGDRSASQCGGVGEQTGGRGKFMKEKVAKSQNQEISFLSKHASGSRTPTSSSRPTSHKTCKRNITRFNLAHETPCVTR